MMNNKRLPKKITHFEGTTVDNYLFMLQSTSKGLKKPRKFELSFIDNLNNSKFTFELNYADLKGLSNSLLTHVLYSRKNKHQMIGQRNVLMEKIKRKRKLKEKDIMKPSNV